jgi:PTH1 family peptidyl-tRNA hydrolase
LSDVVVFQDELELPPGKVRIKTGGGIAGHNGLRDISQRLATHEYWRLRLGVGKPPPGTEGGDYVLQKPSPEDRAAIDRAIDNALSLLPQMLSGDMQGAMNKLHTEPKQEEKPPAKKEPEKKEPPIKEPGKKEPEKKAEPAESAAAAKPEKKGLFGGLLGKKK